MTYDINEEVEKMLSGKADEIEYNDRVCDVCGASLVREDEYWACPVYLEGADMSADEHTAYPAA